MFAANGDTRVVNAAKTGCDGRGVCDVLDGTGIAAIVLGDGKLL